MKIFRDIEMRIQIHPTMVAFSRLEIRRS